MNTNEIVAKRNAENFKNDIRKMDNKAKFELFFKDNDKVRTMYIKVKEKDGNEEAIGSWNKDNQGWIRAIEIMDQINQDFRLY